MPTLPERLLLLSLDDDGQPRDPRSALSYALAGAAIAELLLAGRLAHRDGRLQVDSAVPTGDPVLDEVLGQVEAEPRPRKLSWWVSRLGGGGGWRRPAVRNHLIDHLTSTGVLAKGQERVLGLFPVTRHPPAEPTADDQARAAVRAVLVGGREPDEATASLVALVEASGLVDACVERSERRQARQRAKQIAAGDQVGEAVRRVQQEVMAAITVAIAASAAASASSGDGGASGGGS
jgi:hypothetical protein